MSFTATATARAIGPILAATWLAQLSLGLLLQVVDPLPHKPLLIERRSCAPGQWAELVERYRGLHRQHQWRQQRLAPVILYGVFGERTLSAPPSPGELLALAGEGVPQGQRNTDLRRRHPGALELRCGNVQAVPSAAGEQGPGINGR
ncbi:MAG: hypothetical protein ACKOZW_10070 [Cyanobium sp.]